MRRRVANPPNPYLSDQREWLGEPPAVALEVYEERVKSILTHNDSPDIPFRWSVNPYRGCQHACAYCYARPTHEYLGLGAGTDFDSKITVKINAPEMLAKALRNPRWTRESIAFSGVTDCYQPLESVYRLTRQCLEVCRDVRNPAGIVTKSLLVERDADVLAELSRVASVRVYLSIPILDAAVSRKIEPSAPVPALRFRAMRTLHAAGVPVGVVVAPVIPGLNDRDIPAILAEAAACGAEGAGFMPLRLPGNVREVFLERLRKELPDRAERVETLIRQMRGGRWNDARFGHRGRGQGEYWDSVTQLFNAAARKHGLRHREVSENGPPIAPEKSSSKSTAQDQPRTAQAAKPQSVQLTLFGEAAS